jgi:hypothetical protein
MDPGHLTANALATKELKQGVDGHHHRYYQ